MSTLPTPKVFISYSWTSTEHVDWVVAFAEKLVGDGVNVILDQWDLRPGQDKYVFMEQMVKDPAVTKVIAVCDQMYADKADGRAGGVGTETQIISREVYENVSQEKFIPIIREFDDEGKACVPTFFASRLYINFCEENEFQAKYDELLRNLYNKPERVKPKLGKPPAHLTSDNPIAVPTVQKLERLKFAVMNGKPTARGLLQEYLDAYLDSWNDLRIDFKNVDGKSHHQKVIDSIGIALPQRDNFVDFLFFCSEYILDDDFYDRFHGFLEQLLSFGERPESIASWSDNWWDNYRFLIYELFLYTIATLIKTKKYQFASRLIEDEYYYHSGYRSTDFSREGASAFQKYCQLLDEQYVDNGIRQKSKGILLEERAKHVRIGFRDLFQAEFLLMIRRYFPNPGKCSYWHPECVRYARGIETLELFSRSVAQNGLKPLSQLLRVNTINELHGHLVAMKTNQSFFQMIPKYYFLNLQFDQICNFKEIEHYALNPAKK